MEGSKMAEIFPLYLLKLDPSDDAKWLLWGKLVKTWATGENRLGDGKKVSETYYWPTSREELEEQMVTAGICRKGDGTVPDTILAVTVNQMTDPHLVINLPSKHDVVRAEKNLPKAGSGNVYTIPDFYESACGNPIQCPAGQPAIDFNDCMVGEYVISYCA
jgi:hypothetical protein